MVRARSRSRTSVTTMLASSRLLGHGDVEIADAAADVGDDGGDLRALRSGLARLSMKTRTGPSNLRIRSTRPATWNSAPNVTLKKPSMISASVKVLRSVGAALGDLGIFGRGGGAARQRGADADASAPKHGRMAAEQSAHDIVGFRQASDCRAMAAS